MGTSTRWDGPRWGHLVGESRRAVRAVESAATDSEIPFPRDGTVDVLGQDWIEDQGRRWLNQLHRDLRADPDAYGLRVRATAMGRAFVRAYDGLRERGDPDLMQVVGEFALRVVGARTGVVDAAGRRAAVQVGERLFGPAGEALFCLLYHEFFADLVAEFLRAVIAEEIRFALPALVPLDPSGRIVDWIARRLVALVPDPCCEAATQLSRYERAVELVPQAVDVVLGLWERE